MTINSWLMNRFVAISLYLTSKPHQVGFDHLPTPQAGAKGTTNTDFFIVRWDDAIVFATFTYILGPWTQLFIHCVYYFHISVSHRLKLSTYFIYVYLPQIVNRITCINMLKSPTITRLFQIGRTIWKTLFCRRRADWAIQTHCDNGSGLPLSTLKDMIDWDIS